MIGLYQKLVTDIVDDVIFIIRDLANYRCEFPVALFQVHERDGVAILALPAFRNRKDAKTLILGNAHALKSLRICAVFINKSVLRLRGAELVIIDLLKFVLRI